MPLYSKGLTPLTGASLRHSQSYVYLVCCRFVHGTLHIRKRNTRSSADTKTAGVTIKPAIAVDRLTLTVTPHMTYVNFVSLIHYAVMLCHLTRWTVSKADLRNTRFLFISLFHIATVVWWIKIFINTGLLKILCMIFVIVIVIIIIILFAETYFNHLWAH